MGFGTIKRKLIGNPLSTAMAQHERIPKWKALAVLSSDALSSVAYATEEILIPLSLFASAAVVWSLPVAMAIVSLLIIVTISYQQTISAYPNGGGAYTVAKENLGVTSGLVAAAALLIDYILTVSVSVAAGVENIAAAFPVLLAHKEAIGIFVILLIMLFNLRGVKESANVFAIPTYLFIFSFVILIIVGVFNLATGKALPMAPVIHETYPEIPLFLLLRAFSSGCAALTGIEAISNGIPIFKEPAQKNAKMTMLWMSSILGVLFIGITLLAHVYGVIPKEGETAVSLLASAVFGKEGFYYVVQAVTALILILAANTSFQDFPRLSSLLAKDGFLPRQLAILGDRLVFSNGIIGLGLAAIGLIILFEGDTHHLIPLYAVGVFLSFTLSQTGMIFHHIRDKEPGWKKSLFFNVLGAMTTAVVLTVISFTKFAGGAWMVIVLIPLLVIVFKKIKRHYLITARQLSAASAKNPLPQGEHVHHTAIIPVAGIHPGVQDSVRYGLSISNDLRACCVDINAEQTEKLTLQWKKIFPEVPLVVLDSPYRSVISPILNYVDKVQAEISDDVITVIIPEFVTSKWYHKFLHNQTALLLYTFLRGKKDIVVTSVRYHLDA